MARKRVEGKEVFMTKEAQKFAEKSASNTERCYKRKDPEKCLKQFVAEESNQLSSSISWSIDTNKSFYGVPGDVVTEYTERAYRICMINPEYSYIQKSRRSTLCYDSATAYIKHRIKK